MKSMKSMRAFVPVIAAVMLVAGAGLSGARTAGVPNSQNVTVKAGLLRQTVGYCWPSSFASFDDEQTRSLCRLELHYLDEHIGDSDPTFP